MSMFPERLKAARIQSSLTRSQLASTIGVKKAAITRWESGSREPNFTRLVELCDVLDVSSDYLLGRIVYYSDNHRSVTQGDQFSD